jgi:PAS domain S-box-containing protein
MSADVRTDPRLTPEELARYGADELPAFLAVPLLKGKNLVAVLAVHQNYPRAWTDAEVQLLGIVAERTWLAVENARLYRAARREEERFRALVQVSSQMVWTNDAEGKADDIPQWRAYTGQTADEVRGYGWLDALHPDDRARAGAVWRRAFEARAVYECDYRLRGRDGAYRWFLSRAVPLLNEDGTLREYIGMSTNIDAERRAEEKQRRIAETLQRSMLITPLEGAFPCLDVKPHYEAAWDEALVGGDFHDAFALAGGRVALVVGDVTGKGLEAASYTTEVKFALRAFLREDADPASALSRLDRFLRDGQLFDRRAIGTFVCLSLAVVDPVGGEAVFAIAGCEPPLIVRAADRRVDAIRAGGLPLGTGFDVVPDGRRPYEREVVPLAPGDLLVMTTDGITEARAADRSVSFFGIEGLVDAVLKAASDGDETASLSDIAAAALDAAKAFAGGGGLNDDVCLLLARRRAAPLKGVMEDELVWPS